MGLLRVGLAEAHGWLGRIDARLERIVWRLDPTQVALDIDQCAGRPVGPFITRVELVGGLRQEGAS